MIRARQLFTDRLRIIPGSAEMGRAELEDRVRFGVLLDATVPTDWPPPLNDENSMKFFTKYVEANPDSVGWAAWYFAMKRPDGGFTAVGNGGFKGEPDASGTVEIGYSIRNIFQTDPPCLVESQIYPKQLSGIFINAVEPCFFFHGIS